MEENQNTIVMLALTKKRGGKKVLAPSMEGYETGYNIDGIYIKVDEVSRIFALKDMAVGYGIDTADLPETDSNYGKIIATMDGMDGEENTQCIIDIYQLTSGAAVSAKEYGWLPSGGEMSMLKDNKEAVNALLEAAGGDVIGNAKYWLSLRRNASYPWFYDGAEDGFGSWKGGSSQLLVRPCMYADAYETQD